MTKKKSAKKSVMTMNCVANLTYANYLEYAETIVKSVQNIVAVSGICITNLSTHTGLHYNTVKRVLSGKIAMFKTYNALNEFVKRVVFADEKVKSDLTSIRHMQDAEMEFEEIDEQYDSKDIN